MTDLESRLRDALEQRAESTSGVAWRVSYKRSAKQFCVGIETAADRHAGSCEPVEGTETTAADRQVAWAIVHDTSLVRVEANGVEGRVFSEPDWQFSIIFAVRSGSAPVHLVGFDADGGEVWRTTIDCGVGGSCEGVGASATNRATATTTP